MKTHGLDDVRWERTDDEWIPVTLMVILVVLVGYSIVSEIIGRLLCVL